MVEWATGLRTHVLNDVVGYATYDRWFYPSPEERCRAVLLISQGIGAKLIINGDVAMRMPMEIGNFILHENGAPCECGKRGCLEATAGTRAIVERVKEVTGQVVDDIECAVALAEPQETCSDEATEVFRTAGRDLARGIGTVQVIANPSSWAIYGPASLLAKSSRASDAFLGSLRTSRGGSPSTPTRVARFGDARSRATKEHTARLSSHWSASASPVRIPELPTSSAAEAGSVAPTRSPAGHRMSTGARR